MSRAKPALPVFAAVCFCSLVLNASPVVLATYSGSFPATISGTLPNQGTALEETFTLPSLSTLTITTTSYATGGFEPNLFLYNASGNFIGSGDPFGVADPATGIVGDMQLTESGLAAGTYIVALTDFLLNQSITATNLSAGFTVNYGSGTTFVDANGNTRTGNYSFTIAAAPVSAVPEPSTGWVAAPLFGLLASRLVALIRRRSQRS